ncbi:hypothetical protein EI545_15995 [Tabrizicola piscis]|uniref:Fe2OG dioxygenase domain-containing protein n=1 Tax=Tabrizicola piscis TaxID=2494374 RepID=A0A3S8U9C1_9RHOB|nr:hypothetical protein [Tabrizicola piscis]AZL60197.1 hypothetical protein EI545_15995 [Tabrizicola piscis]
MIKVLAYFPSEDWATGKHFDKSLLTLVMHATDVKSDKFVIGPFSQDGTSKFLETPDRYVSDRTKPGKALIFPGMMWEKLGVPSLKPSPHAVMPHRGPGIRFSVIAFLLAPNLNLRDLFSRSA